MQKRQYLFTGCPQPCKPVGENAAGRLIPASREGPQFFYGKTTKVIFDVGTGKPFRLQPCGIFRACGNAGL